MNEATAREAFASMSNKTRLKILKCLVGAGRAGMTAGDIAAQVGASPSRTSFHLSNMSAAGLVDAHRQARQIIYAVRFDTIGALVRFLLEDCCRNDPSLRACCGLPPETTTSVRAAGGGDT